MAEVCSYVILANLLVPAKGKVIYNNNNIIMINYCMGSVQ